MSKQINRINSDPKIQEVREHFKKNQKLETKGEDIIKPITVKIDNIYNVIAKAAEEFAFNLEVEIPLVNDKKIHYSFTYDLDGSLAIFLNDEKIHSLRSKNSTSYKYAFEYLIRESPYLANILIDKIIDGSLLKEVEDYIINAVAVMWEDVDYNDTYRDIEATNELFTNFLSKKEIV